MTLNQSILILYGTQTGTSQEVGERLSRQLQRHHIPSRVLSIEQYDKTELIRESVVLFIVSTTGQGEFPFSMKDFWKFLMRKNLPTDILTQLKYSVFGLGDSSYEFYNVVGKKVFKRIAQLGATPLFPFGDGDDQHYLGYEGGLKQWWEGVLENLRVLYPSDKTPLSPEVCLPPQWKLIPSQGTLSDSLSDHMIMDDNSGWINMKVIENNMITPEDHFQESRHLTLQFDESNIEIQPGDIASFYPQNLPDSVDHFLELNQWKAYADQLYKFEPLSQDTFVPVYLRAPKTLRQILTSFIDFNSIPKYTFFEYLYHFTDDEMIKEKILEWLTPEGMDDRISYTYRVKRTIPEVLSDFNCAIPLEYLLDSLPSLKPRSFSIANCSAAQRNQVQLAIGVIHYKTKLSTIRTGVCTQWISKRAARGDSIWVRIIQGSLRVPPNPNTPIIMISPGLGVAPFRGLIQYRQVQNSNENYLYFGCRHPDKDQYYREEFNSLEAEGKLTYKVGYSRYQDDKVYVQHLLEKDEEKIQKLVIEQGAWIYLCGSSNNMPKQVESTLIEIFSNYPNQTIDGKQFWNQLKKEKRFWLESWS